MRWRTLLVIVAVLGATPIANPAKPAWAPVEAALVRIFQVN